MKILPLLAALVLSGAPAAVALADPVPRHTAGFSAHHAALVEHEGASPETADCVATGDDLVLRHPEYDELTVTRTDIARAEEIRGAGPFSPNDRRPVSSVLELTAAARQRGYGSWMGVTLRCGFTAKGGLTAIEIVTEEAQD